MAVRIEHAKSLRHVLKGGVEQDFLLPQLAFRLPIAQCRDETYAENDRRCTGNDKEREAGDRDAASLTRVGSGMTNTAPMPVKCMKTIASVKRTTAINVFTQSSRLAAKKSERAPNAMPNAIEATTRFGAQVMRPGTSSAIIPV